VIKLNEIDFSEDDVVSVRTFDDIIVTFAIHEKKKEKLLLKHC